MWLYSLLVRFNFHDNIWQYLDRMEWLHCMWHLRMDMLRWWIFYCRMEHMLMYKMRYVWHLTYWQGSETEMAITGMNMDFKRVPHTCCANPRQSVVIPCTCTYSDFSWYHYRRMWNLQHVYSVCTVQIQTLLTLSKSIFMDIFPCECKNMTVTILPYVWIGHVDSSDDTILQWNLDYENFKSTNPVVRNP